MLGTRGKSRIRAMNPHCALSSSKKEIQMRNALRSKLALGSLFLAFALTATAAGPKAYVGNFKDNSVSVIDTGTGTVVATVPVSAGPHGMTATPDGRMGYVSGDGSSEVSGIDASTDRR